ncbi:hypothetical protein CN918_32565 [Priestia megaterium]|nr:hypothetical protein CN918_32565 [Priestia megaterium]
MRPLITRIHWNRFERKWTVKTSKGCPRHLYVLVDKGWSVEIKPYLRSNPKGFVLTYSDHISFPTKEQAQSMLFTSKYTQLLYDKDTMTFNINSGKTLLFVPEGAFIIF